MARAANLGGIGRRGLRERIEAKIEAEIAARAVRVAMTGVLVAEDLKVAMKAGPAAAGVAARSMGSPKSSWRS
jgi:hypothetical protein